MFLSGMAPYELKPGEIVILTKKNNKLVEYDLYNTIIENQVCVPDYLSFPKYMNIMEIINMYGFSKEEAREAGRKALLFPEVDENTLISVLSGGEKQRVALTIFFAHLKKNNNNSKLIILSNIAKGLNPEKRAYIYGNLPLNEEGIILYYSNYEEENFPYVSKPVEL